MAAEKEEAAAGKVDTRGPTSFFHGKAERDYQGRSWMEAPRDRRKVGLERGSNGQGLGFLFRV